MIKRGVDLLIVSPSRLFTVNFNKKTEEVRCCEVCKFPKRLCGIVCKYRKAYYVELLKQKGVIEID